MQTHEYTSVLKSEAMNKFVDERTEVPFDPSNPEHVKAFLLLQNESRQHPTLRFQLEQPFVSVFDMMKTKIAVHHALTNIA